MDRKLLSVFFSALICSTLGHEYHRANEISHAARHKSRHHVGSGHQYRRSSEDCSYTCPVPAPNRSGGSYLRILTIDELNAFAIINNTVHVAVVFDADSALILDGLTGILIWINVKTQNGLYFKVEEKVGWIHADIELLGFLLKLGSSLSDVQKLGKGEKFNIKSAPHHMAVEVSAILKFLAPSLTAKLDKQPKGAIPVIGVITKMLAEHTSIIKLLLSKLETRKVIVEGELTTIAASLIGMGMLDNRLGGKLNVLITENFKLSLLLSSGSGLEILISLLKQAGDSVDVGKLLGNIIKTPDNLLEVIVELDGGFYRGIAGIIAVVHNVYLFEAKKISLEALIDIVIQVAAQNTEKVTKEKWNTEITNFIQIINTQTEKYKNQDRWSAVSKFFNDIKDGKLVVGGINVSAIIDALISTSGETSFVVVLKVLLLLEVVVSLTYVLAILFLRVLWFVISGEGIIYILKLLPKVKITVDDSSSKSIITQILGGVQLTKIMQYVLKLDVVGVITHLPVIGDIFDGIEAAYKETGNGKVTLTQSLKESGTVVEVVKGWIWYGLGLGGGKQPSGGSVAGSSFVGGGTSVSWTYKYKSTVTWTQSGQSIVAGSGGSDSGASGTATTAKSGGGSGWGWSWGWGGSKGSSGSSSSGGSSGSGSAGGSGGSSSSAGGSGGSSGSGSAGGSGGSSGSGSAGSSGGSSGSGSAGGSGGSSGSGSAGGSGGSSGSAGGSGGGSGSGGSSGSAGGSGSGGFLGSLGFGGSSGASSSGSSSGGSSSGGSGSSSSSGGGSGSSKGGSKLSWGWSGGWGR